MRASTSKRPKRRSRMRILFQKPLRWLMRQGWLVRGVEMAVVGYIRLVYATSRWQMVADDASMALVENAKTPIICAFWHGRLLMMPMAWPKQRGAVHVLISHHRDGVLIANIIQRLGFGVVAGSSSRGGVQASRRLLEKLAEGESIAITPDGPRGPRQSVAKGTIAMARLSGRAVIPVAYSTSRGRFLPSWDRFLLPFPLSRGVFVVGAPLSVSGDEDEASASERLQQALITVTRQADHLVGKPSPV